MRKWKLNSRLRTMERDIRAARRARRRNEAKELIKVVKRSGVPKRQSVVVLVFDQMEGDITGYTNVDPIVAAVALIAYLDRTRPPTIRGSA